MTSYRFATVDPRSFALADELQKLAAMGSTLGAEVTVPALAAALTAGNIDPQHLGGDVTTAAIEVAVTWPLPPAGTTIVTVRPDADSIGVMAVLALREEGVELDRFLLSTVRMIAADDKTRTDWRPNDKTHPEAIIGVKNGVFGIIGFRQVADVDWILPIHCLKAVCFDHNRSMDERVTAMKDFLIRSSFMGIMEVSDRLRAERHEHLAVAAEVRLVSGVAVVESTSRFAVQAAYAQADVVVAVNPAFSFQGGQPHRKVTICQARLGLVNLTAVFAALSAIEPGWGGSPTIGGSPQGESSLVPLRDIVAQVAEQLSK